MHNKKPSEISESLDVIRKERSGKKQQQQQQQQQNNKTKTKTNKQTNKQTNRQTKQKQKTNKQTKQKKNTDERISSTITLETQQEGRIQRDLTSKYNTPPVNLISTVLGFSSKERLFQQYEHVFSFYPFVVNQHGLKIFGKLCFVLFFKSFRYIHFVFRCQNHFLLYCSR